MKALIATLYSMKKHQYHHVPAIKLVKHETLKGLVEEGYDIFAAQLGAGPWISLPCWTWNNMTTILQGPGPRNNMVF